MLLSTNEYQRIFKNYFKALRAYTSMPRYIEMISKISNTDFNYADFKDVFESVEYKKLLEELRK